MRTYFFDVLFHHYADFSGRATRKQYWLFVLWSIIFAFVIGIICGIFKLGTIVIPLLSLALIIPQLAIFVRRIKDTGHSAYWGILMAPSILSTIVSFLPRSVTGNQTIVPVLSLVGGFSLLCFIGILIFALLPSKK